jgi:hypothetical protein
MARKPNYDFEKRRKEQERRAKKEAKAQRKKDAREAGIDPTIAESDDLAGLGLDTTEVPGADEETTAPEQQVE